MTEDTSTPISSGTNPDNHIYLYDELTSVTALRLARELRSLDARLRSEAIDRWNTGPLTPIWLHVNSQGGTGFDSFAVADIIASLSSPVYSIIEGVAASGATLVSMAASKRYITVNSLMMIHQASGEMWGRYSELKDNMAMYGIVMDRLTTFYALHSSLGEKQVGDMLQHDTWMTSYQALQYGMVDRVLGGGK